MRTLVAVLVAVALLGGAVAVAEETVRFKGSDTIGGKLTPEVAEAFRAQYGPDTGFVIEALGSSTGFAGLFDGSADLAASSRPINEKELETAHNLGMSLREVVIAYDGVAVIVHPDNPVRELSVAQLSALFTGRVRNWKEVGGHDRPVRLISRPSYSGTHVFFKEKAVRRGNAKGPEEMAASTEWVEENGAIVRAVSGDPRAISYVGLGWVQPGVRVVPVQARPGEPGVLPSADTVRTGRYPLYRPLLVYVPPAPRLAALQLLRFLLSEDGRRIVESNGFVPPDAGTPLPQFLAAVSMPALARVAQAAPKAPAAEAPAAAPKAVDARPQPQPAATPVARREVVRAFFAFGSMAISPEAAAVLDGVAAKVRAGGLDAVLVGHADAKGPTEVNRRVALARAQAAAAYLRSRGVADRLLRLEGSGSDTPLATNDTAAGRAQNRRVDIELLPLGR